MIAWNGNPTDKQLRQFGVLCAVGLPLFGFFWTSNPVVIGALVSVGIVISGCGWFAPSSIKPAFLVMSLITFPIGWVISELSLLIIYFLLFLPIGLMLRCVRLLSKKKSDADIDYDRESYWQPRTEPESQATFSPMVTIFE